MNSVDYMLGCDVIGAGAGKGAGTHRRVNTGRSASTDQPYLTKGPWKGASTDQPHLTKGPGKGATDPNAVARAQAQLKAAASKVVASAASLESRARNRPVKGAASSKVHRRAINIATKANAAGKRLLKLATTKFGPSGRGPAKTSTSRATIAPHAIFHVVGDALSDATAAVQQAQKDYDSAKVDAKQVASDLKAAQKARDAANANAPDPNSPGYAAWSSQVDQTDNDYRDALDAAMNLIFNDTTLGDAQTALDAAKAALAAIQANPPSTDGGGGGGGGGDGDSTDTGNGSTDGGGDDLSSLFEDDAFSAASLNDQDLHSALDDADLSDFSFNDSGIEAALDTGDDGGSGAGDDDGSAEDDASDAGYDGSDDAGGDVSDEMTDEVVVGEEASFLDRMRRVAPLWGWGLGGVLLVGAVGAATFAWRR